MLYRVEGENGLIEPGYGILLNDEEGKRYTNNLED
jgi:hypothetical protein